MRVRVEVSGGSVDKRTVTFDPSAGLGHESYSSGMAEAMLQTHGQAPEPDAAQIRSIGSLGLEAPDAVTERPPSV
jgi:hypothetical protein